MPTTTAAALPTLDHPLLRPLELAGLTLPNRVVLAPTTRCRATGPDLVPTDRHAAYYAQRAGAGLLVTESLWVSERAIGYPGVPGLFTAAQVAGWRRVTDLVHALGGRIVAQLWHTGAASHPDHLGGRRPAGPSAVNPRLRSFTPGGFRPTVTPRELGRAEIAGTVAEFRRASRNAHRAGFDGVELAAHGQYLIAQFLNPRLNRRTDAYGGSRAARRRLLLDLVAATAEPWADRAGVGVRLAPYLEPGELFTADEGQLAELDELVGALNDHPVAYLHLRGRDVEDAGGAVAGTPDLAAIDRYRRLFHGPLIANNGFDRDSAGVALSTGTADAVSFARHFIANPDLVTRLALARPLAAPDPETYYTGGVHGYLDYPADGWTE
ncbi:alkene reductase [Kitasatospora sp. LaBMicrA B282]|uniref:alkene reductase n=1 Tax=Kitasatospora sp. LaBMicrA B282 TaxID=3420949 RepID=UPI003D14EE30